MGSRISAKSSPVNVIIRWEYDNISVMNPVAIDTKSSPVNNFGGLTWKLFATTEQSARTGQVSHLGIYIDCRNPGSSKFWSCKTRSTVKLINRDDDSKTITGKVDVTFYPDSNALGTGVFKLVLLNKVLDPTEGYIQGDRIIAEADITIVQTYGVGVPQSVNEFAEPTESSDVCLIIEDKKVHVAKAILAAHSPVFKAMFYGKYQEREKEEIPIQDIKHKDFVDLLNVVYSSLYKICDDSVERILVLADRFQVNNVLEACELYLITNSRMSIAQKLLLADVYKLNDAQAQLIYTIKDMPGIKTVQKDDSYDTYSDALKAKILDRSFELA